jgi:signal transduction histidine kinase
MFITYIPFLLFIRVRNKSVNWRIVAVLPILAIFPIPLVHYLFTLAETYNGKPTPALITWLLYNFNALEQAGFVGLLIFFSWSLLQRYEQLQKQITQETLAKERLAREKELERNQLIAQQKVQLEKEVDERTAELQHSLQKLKTTQAQLIQREKMASLGELTAGIAHEIQNPLNFVNNFSEVNKELLAEMKEEIAKGNMKEVKSIVADIEENEQKINQHGRRADSIVKGMLQHSRTSTDQKVLTDINALAEEYLSLSYHGLRAKNKDFKANLVTDYDQQLSQVKVVPQELGRVLLNLYNNAFYATLQKKVLLNGPYLPEIKVSTCQHKDQIEIRVRDNGIGIPENIKNKIFQPFFTTKPTGQGTGLGLSLSYDIITKGHQGELKVESQDGEYTKMTVHLPV